MNGKFRKLPVVIEAVQLPVRMADLSPETAVWLGEAVKDGTVQFSRTWETARIVTLEGVMAASRGDWIIRGVKGELYPCKPDVFAATYEPVAAPDGAQLPATDPGAAWGHNHAPGEYCPIPNCWRAEQAKP